MAHGFREFFGGQVGVRGGEDLRQPLIAAGHNGLHVVRQRAPERLPPVPLRVVGRQGLDAGQGEHELEVDRLFTPERAVVVESRDAFGRGNETR